ncbi:MAG: DUF547 domain-containing protein [Verrucomicrobia bacterium]|nr:DUF547 domain-containing protein [Verrucomicrobiota bacterium]
MKIYGTTLLASFYCLLLTAEVALAKFDHSLFDEILKTHVKSGLVNYVALKEDKRLENYLALLSEADLALLDTREEKMAFWINAYNAYTLKLIVAHYPTASILDIPHKKYESPWEIPLAKVAGQTHTLDHIENGILRVKFPDSRIHYALVCAARSCPQLRSEAYTEERLYDQMNEQGTWFMENRNSFDLKTRTMNLSKVFEWYAVDFGEDASETLRTIAPFTNPSIRESIEKNSKAWKITFSEWDWRLNLQN